MASFSPTGEQNLLAEIIKAKEIHAIGIDAGPGCGKSSTLVFLASLIDQKGQMTCFGRDIKEDLNKKLEGTDFQAKTFNGIGWSSIAQHIRKKHKYTINFYKNLDNAKYKHIAESIITGERHDRLKTLDIRFPLPPQEMPSVVYYDLQYLMDKLTYYCMVTMSNPNNPEDLMRLIESYGLTPNIDDPNIKDPAAVESAMMDYAIDTCPAMMQIGEAAIGPDANFWQTFTDQIFYTLKWELYVWKTPYLFIDEAQDVSNMELQLLAKCLKFGGYVVIVGDPEQSIMQFKGAMTGSFERVCRFFKAKVYPLSATFRCARRIVNLAQLIKPELQAYFDREGSIEISTPEASASAIKKAWEAGEDVAVIARLNAPLIETCIELIKLDIPATILGGHIGEQLNKVLDKIAMQDSFTFELLSDHLDTYRNRQLGKLRKRKADESEIKAINDTVRALDALISRYTSSTFSNPATNLSELQFHISALFSDDTGAKMVKLMTAHKSKGLEFDTVFMITDSFKISGDEGYVWFVAVTRAKDRLVVVAKEKPDWLKGHIKGDANYIAQLPAFVAPVTTASIDKPIADYTKANPEPDEIDPSEMDTEEIPLPLIEDKRELSTKQQNVVDWAKKLLKEEKFVVLDTETTGFTGEIIQLSVIDYQGNTLINTHIKPSHYEIDPGAQAVHGISMEMLVDAPSFADIYATLCHVVKDKVVIAYNSNFDRERVYESCKVSHVPQMNHLAAQWNCAMLKYAHYNDTKVGKYGKTGAWWKLTEAMEQEGIEVKGNAHDALTDVRMTLALIQKLANAPITAFDGNNEALAFIEPTDGKFKIGDAVKTLANRHGTVYAYLPPQKYVVHLSGDTYNEYDEVNLTLIEASEPIALPPHDFAIGDKVVHRHTGLVADVTAISDTLISVKFLDGKHMAYSPKDLSPIKSDEEETIEEIIPPQPTNIIPMPKTTMPRRLGNLPAPARVKVETMFKDAPIDKLDEMIELLQELKAKKLAEVQS